MSTTPPEPPQPPPASPGGGYSGLGRNPVQGAILPVPGNAELAVWLLVEIVLAIVAGRQRQLRRARLEHRDDVAHRGVHHLARHREGEPRARAVGRPRAWSG